ncbi:tryptophan-rich sensory protein [Mariniflexile ostreae]|uniref:Tryptophan-rich sensory protein n=1 Tax=Mariniflexile ostreae TaxID=1520892 RepID=A0ABV5FDC6_9FLAO
MKKTLQIGNGLAFVSVVFINYLSNTGVLNGSTIGAVSNRYTSLFTPAGYTFAIWGLIYFMLFGFVVYQAKSLWSKTINPDSFVIKTGWWFILSCLFNALWVVAWLYEYTGVSCVLMFLLLFSLLKIVVNNRMELDDQPLAVIAFLWWPFVVYSGWIAVASIANVSAYLVKIEWSRFGLSEISWTVMVICAAVILNILMVWKRNMREFAVVGAWALVGIGVANKDQYNTVMYVAFGGAIVLTLIVAIHGYQNRKTNPFAKLMDNAL